MLSVIRGVLALLPPGLQRRWFWLVPICIVAALAEALGAAAVFALIAVLGDPGSTGEMPIIGPLLDYLPWQGDRARVVGFTAIIVVFYWAKNALQVARESWKARISARSLAALSKRMLRKALSVPYSLHLKTGPVEFQHSTLNLARTVVTSVFASLLSIVVEGAVILGILAVLLMLSPFSSLAAVTVLGSLAAVVGSLTRRHAVRIGTESQALEKQTFRTMRDALHGLKAIRAAGREAFYLEEFARRQQGLISARTRFVTLNAASRLLVESLFIGALLVAVAVLAGDGGLGSGVVPTLGLYAYAGFRIIPSSNRIVLHLNNLWFGRPAAEQVIDFDRKLARALDAQPFETPGRKLAFERELRLQGVSFKYEGAAAAALRDIDLTIRRGESVGVVGPTGAGKSTLVDLLLGLLTPTAGRISVDGVDLREAPSAWREHLGYVPQDLIILDTSLRQNIGFGQTEADISEERVAAAIRLAQLQDLVARLPEGLDTRLGERGVRLSGGERQRVAVARAVYEDPELLLFDEATSALDNDTEQALTSALEALRGTKTQIVVAHRLTSVRGCDRLVLLRDGSVEAIGSYESLVDARGQLRRATA